jgi:hypothetical protein
MGNAMFFFGDNLAFVTVARQHYTLTQLGKRCFNQTLALLVPPSAAVLFSPVIPLHLIPHPFPELYYFPPFYCACSFY